MNEKWNRRKVLKTMAVASTGLALPATSAASSFFLDDAHELEIQLSAVSAHTIRLTIFPGANGKIDGIATDGSLIQKSWSAPIAKLTGKSSAQTIKSGDLSVLVDPAALTFNIKNAKAETIQTLSIDRATGAVQFVTGEAPLLGLGEGGPQFDRRGSIDAMISGQGGYKLGTHGGRVPIPWLIGTAGWAMFFHQPFGTFDFTGAQSKFKPTAGKEFPLDIFFIASSDPAAIMAEYVRLTGHPEMPPMWSLGYQQSHRTLGTPEEILAEAKMFRDKKLPCDAMIYLGTGFCPNGWNSENGAFSWNERAFPDPKAAIDQLHKDNFKVVLHDVIITDRLRGTVHDPCSLASYDAEQASCFWDAHRKNMALGVDGWWPDEGDPLDIPSRLVRNRMHWEGPQIDRPNERAYALHRNGYAGMQRYASFLWSGDVYSTWETLKTHIPIAINTALTGIPLWGTDIGGFVPTKEFTAELYLRWFQFGAFCPLFRCHGRTWKLRLPWGWNTGDPGPVEIRNYDGASVPDVSQLHNEQVEQVCRKYLELRYRMLPYLYSLVHENATTGMPIMRALWLHYSDDAKAVAREDEYLWGRDVLVAPVVEKGASSRQVYLPKGSWYDFWTNEHIEGGREITRTVDLETIPLYVRAGAMLPQGPVKQYTSEKVEGPLSISIYPGADSSFLLYEDDGKSFNYRKGEWMGTQLTWNDAQRKLSLKLAAGSRMLEPERRSIEISLLTANKKIVFEGNPVEVTF